LRTLTTALTAILLALASLPSHSANLPQEKPVTWYDVEIVVFRNLDTRSTETWPTDAGVPDISNARPLFPPSGNDAGNAENAAPTSPENRMAGNPGAPTPYVPLDKASHRLTGVVDSLRRSSKYEPLLHVAWTQPPLERDQAPAMRITLPDALAPEAESNDESSPENITDEEALLHGEVPEFLAETGGVPVARPLDGTVQLSVSRYLHIDLDLLYLPDDLNLAVLRGATPATRGWTEEEKLERERRRRDIIEALARGDITIEEAEILSLEPDEQVFQGFRVDQYRRLRSREVHYFDHPVLSVIVTVTPREVSARTMDTGTTQPVQ